MYSIDPKSATNSTRLHNIHHVLDILTISRSAWYAGIQSGIYPAGLKLGKRSRRWTSEEIELLIKELSK